MERFGSTFYRGFSVKSIFMFIAVVFITTLLWVTFGNSATAHAADASWSGDTIIYDGHGFTKATDYNDASDTIPSGATVYQTPPQVTAGSDARKIFIIYFTSGVDPPKAEKAKYVEFTVSSSQALSEPKNSRDITLTTKDAEDLAETSSCSVGGIGWIICPVSVYIAEGMDWAFTELSKLIAVQPSVLSDPNNSMYVAWNVMRNIANVAFVIAFLIIIYSQLTSFGVSNYGLKKLIPRLIIAAILVNVSFIVSAIAIDISNILGYSIQNVFNAIREDMFHITNDNFAGVNDSPWTTITAVVLSGGGLIGGAYFVASGSLYMLVPLLIGLILTLIFVIIVLAARQAIIVILVIIAPIAFVANLLPNTEKWFEKWKDLFVTMLIFFPAFSLVFGGSQLAGQLIIQNAGDNIVMVIFGMAVQIAPLVITPLLLKLSGSLLGRIAQIANNPSKGILDRSKNWAGARGELTKQRNMDKGVTGNPLTWGNGLVQGSEFRKKRLQDRTNMYKQKADNKYHASNEYGEIHEEMHGAELDKQRIDSQHASHIGSKVNARGTSLNLKTIELENAKVSAERTTAQTSEMLSGYRAGNYETQGNVRLTALQKTMAENVIQTAAWKQGEQNNQYAQQRNISSRMRNDSSLLDIAQGYGDSELQLIGRERAQAAAVATITKLNKDARDNVITLMETQAVEAQMSVKDYAIKNVFTKAISDDAGLRSQVSRTQLEAALEVAAADGQVSVFDDARANKYVDQDIVDAVVARNVGNMKSKGGFHIQADPNLSLQRYIEAFNNGDLSKGTSLEDVEQAFVQDQKIARLGTLSNTTSTNLAGMKYGAFERLAKEISGPDSLLNAIPLGPDGKPASKNDRDMVQKIFESLRGALDDPSTRASITDRLAYARNIEEAVRAKFFPQVEATKLSEQERVVPGGGERPSSMEDVGTIPTADIDPTDGSPSDTPPPK
jgi:hypothetical protein